MSAAQPGPVQDEPREATRVQQLADALSEHVAPRVPLRLAPPARRRAPRVPFVALVGSVLLAGIVGLLLFNTSMQQGSFTASSMETRAAALEARQQTLQMQIEDLRNPQRVARQARRLGMVSAGNPAFLDLSDGSVLGDPEEAAAVDGLRIEPKRAAVPEALQPERIVVVDKSLVEGAASRRGDAAGGRTDQRGDEGSPQAREGDEGQDVDE
ncbi:hypothetical protein KLP28_02250 [Nocardioidaceae bacterium]|nr:hypothetical protein KLP28_02250 [Nocardioidaceae bacterium]